MKILGLGKTNMSCLNNSKVLHSAIAQSMSVVRDDDDLFTKFESACFRHSWIRMFTFDCKLTYFVTSLKRNERRFVLLLLVMITPVSGSSHR